MPSESPERGTGHSKSKSKTKAFFHELFGHKESNHTPPTNYASPGNAPRPSNDGTDSLVEPFNALALAGSPGPKYASGYGPDINANNAPYAGNDRPGQVQNQGFIGGFDPNFPSRPPPKFLTPSPIPNGSPGPLPRPPQSLTMQHALNPGFLNPSVDARPHSNPEYTRPPLSISVSSSSTPKPKPSPIPKRRRADSTPPTPTSAASASGNTNNAKNKGLGVQCSGITKAGKRCTRMVKSGPPLVQLMNDSDEVDVAVDDFYESDSDDGGKTKARSGKAKAKAKGRPKRDKIDRGSDTEGPVDRFCFQHSKEMMGPSRPSGYYARKNGEWVVFADYIPEYLQLETQLALRVEMEKVRSQSDVPGYIYTFEIRDPKSPKTIKLKVGRAVNLVKRLDQWGKQCGSKEQVLRGWYPGTVEDEDDNGGGVSLMRGRVVAGEKGAWCHRLERLIHLELADLMLGEVYLESGWPNIADPGSGGTLSASAAKKPLGANKPCADCGAVHKEIFEFKRVERGKFRGKEWEKVVKPVIEKWGSFVEKYV